MAKKLSLTLTTGQAIAPGIYNVNASSLKLVINRRGAELQMTTGYPSSVTFRIPVEGLLATDPEDVAAREAVLSYVAAAWAHHQWPQINAWMENEEDTNGPSVWRLKFCHEYEDSPPEPIRQLIEREVETWLQSHS